MSGQKSAEKRVDTGKVEERTVKAEGTKYLQIFLVTILFSYQDFS